MALKLQALEKYNDELVEKVKFSDISRFLIATGSYTEYECYELLLHANSLQMKNCLQKVKNSLEVGNGNTIWPNFLQGLRQEYPEIAAKLEAEFSLRNVSSSSNNSASGYGSSLKNELTNNKDLKTTEHEPNHNKTKIGKFDKSDIGIPKDYKHLMHIGFTPGQGISKQMDPSFLCFLDKAGVTQDQLNDPKTCQFIFNFLMNYLKEEGLEGSNEN